MIVLDLETSGLDARENSILSLGAVDFENPENTFYSECRLREGTKIDPKALEVNGFTVEKINSANKSCEQLLKDFILWSHNIKDKTIAGHNVHHDFSFLKENFKVYGLEWIFGFRVIDLHSVFYFYFLKNKIDIPMKDGKSNLTLTFIIDYLKLDKRVSYHNALEDAKLTAKAFSILLQS